jgi:hypothetical protein
MDCCLRGINSNSRRGRGGRVKAIVMLVLVLGTTQICETECYTDIYGVVQCQTICRDA